HNEVLARAGGKGKVQRDAGGLPSQRPSNRDAARRKGGSTRFRGGVGGHLRDKKADAQGVAACISSARRLADSAARPISTPLTAKTRLSAGLYLLDTNVVSELRRTRPHKAVLGWIVATDPRSLYLPAVVIGEIQAGIEITRTQSPARASEIEKWLGEIETSWSVLAVDGTAFREWARLMHGRSDELYEDAMIASIARVERLTVATRNGRDFTTFGVEVFDPWKWGA